MCTCTSLQMYMYMYIPLRAAFEKVVHYRGQEYLTQLVDTAGQVHV